MRRTEVVAQIRDIIRRTAPTAKTILYGSEARGEARHDSDIDLLILLAASLRTRTKNRCIYQSDGYVEKIVGESAL